MWTDIVTAIVGVLGLAGGAGGFVYGRVANRKSEKAELEAAQATVTASRAAVAAAEAQTAMAAALSKLVAEPAAAVRWIVQNVSVGTGRQYRLVNTGTAIASQVVVSAAVPGVFRYDEEDVSLPPGQAVKFHTLPTGAGTVNIVNVFWSEAGEDRTTTIRLD